MTSVSIFVRSDVEPDDRSLLTEAIGTVAGCGAHAVEVEYRCIRCGESGHGKPFVTSPLGLFVSLTRSGATVAVAVTDAAPIGIDIEAIAAVGRASVAEALLHPSEHDALDGLSEASTAEHLTRLWTVKEAVLKATGWGLHIDPELLAVDLDDGATLIEWPESLTLDDAPHLTLLDLPNGLVGALALLGPHAGRPSYF